MLSAGFTEILDRAAYLATTAGASAVTTEYLLVAMLENLQVITYLCSHGFVPPAEPLVVVVNPDTHNVDSDSKNPMIVGPDANHQFILKSAFLGATSVSPNEVLEPLHLILAFIVSSPEHSRNFLYNHGFALPKDSEESLAKYRLSRDNDGSIPGGVISLKLKRAEEQNR